jgi:hypothetical protein
MKKTIIITESDLNKIVRKKITEQMESGNEFEQMVSHILFSQIQTHVFHLQTEKYSEHEALEDYYSEINDLLDSLIEVHQGKNGIITNYSSFTLKNYESNENTIEYLTQLISIIENVYDNTTPEIQNILDGIIELIRKTNYKLKNLK